jgi:hypothetical protein
MVQCHKRHGAAVVDGVYSTYTTNNTMSEPTPIERIADSLEVIAGRLIMLTDLQTSRVELAKKFLATREDEQPDNHLTLP